MSPQRPTHPCKSGKKSQTISSFTLRETLGQCHKVLYTLDQCLDLSQDGMPSYEDSLANTIRVCHATHRFTRCCTTLYYHMRQNISKFTNGHFIRHTLTIFRAPERIVSSFPVCCCQHFWPVHVEKMIDNSLEYLDFRSPHFNTKTYGDGKTISRPTLVYFYNHPSLDRYGLRVRRLVFKRRQDNFTVEQIRRIFVALHHFGDSWDTLRGQSPSRDRSNIPRPPLQPHHQGLEALLRAPSVGALIDTDIARSMRRHRAPQGTGWDFSGLATDGNEFAYLIPVPRQLRQATPPDERQGLNHGIASTELAVALVQACLPATCLIVQLLAYPSTVAGLQAFLRESKDRRSAFSTELRGSAAKLSTSLREDARREQERAGRQAEEAAHQGKNSLESS